MQVTSAHCVGVLGQQFMMGGVGFAAGISALQTATQRSLIWASVQFLSRTSIGAPITVDIQPQMEGRTVTQASTTLCEGDRVLMRLSAALGRRFSDGRDRQFVEISDVPPPQACDLRQPRWRNNNDLMEMFERRRATPDDAGGRDRTWIRCLGDKPLTAGLIAIIADFMAGGHTACEGSSSLDNSLRLHTLKPSEWMLCETQFSGFADGIFHGDMRIFCDDGTLLATASQSGRLPQHRSALAGTSAATQTST